VLILDGREKIIKYIVEINDNMILIYDVIITCVCL
jgi:hypothetical protein